MGRLIESTFSTLDGVISNPQDWGSVYWDDQYTGHIAELLRKSDALVLGRKTYEGFAQSWPGRDGEIADRMNSLPKHVASRSGPVNTWNATVISGDAVQGVATLKESYRGDLLKYGTGEFDHGLLAAGLVDELQLWVNPVVAGGGDRLLDGHPLTHFKLIDTIRFDSGIVILRLAK